MSERPANPFDCAVLGAALQQALAARRPPFTPAEIDAIITAVCCGPLAKDDPKLVLAMNALVSRGENMWVYEVGDLGRARPWPYPAPALAEGDLYVI